MVVLAALAWGRVVAPLRLNLRHRLWVASVVAEGPDIVSIYIAGRDLDLIGHAGQFFRWRFLARGFASQAHPFSLSASPHPDWLRLTVKVVGAHTSALRALPIGTRVWAQGPYGAFTALRRTRTRALLIAGGSGIAPIRALLEELPLGAAVIYRASHVQDVVLREELDRLARGPRGRRLLRHRVARRPRAAGHDDRRRHPPDRARCRPPRRLPVRTARPGRRGPAGPAWGPRAAPPDPPDHVRAVRGSAVRRVMLPVTGLIVGTVLLISLRSAPGATRLPHEVAADALAAAQAAQEPAASGDPAGPSAPPPLRVRTAGRRHDRAPAGRRRPDRPVARAGRPSRPPPRPPAPPPPAAGGQRTVTGDSVYTEFGYVTVAVTLSGSRIVDVLAVELPSEHSRSVTINNRAGPILRQRALSAQSAQIDTVSGATYTSEGYRESLQSALDRAAGA